jgi:hypothetical protein
MKPLIYSGTEVKYRVYVQTTFFAEFDPELFGDLTGPLDAFLVFNIKLLEFNDLCEVALHVYDLVLLG